MRVDILSMALALALTISATVYAEGEVVGGGDVSRIDENYVYHLRILPEQSGNTNFVFDKTPRFSKAPHLLGKGNEDMLSELSDLLGDNFDYGKKHPKWDQSKNAIMAYVNDRSNARKLDRVPAAFNDPLGRDEVTAAEALNQGRIAP